MYDFLEYMFINTVSFYALQFICAGIFVSLIILAITHVVRKDEKTEEEWKDYIIKNIKSKKMFISGIGLYSISILVTFGISVLWFKLLGFLGVHIALENVLPIIIPSLIFIFTFIKFVQEKDEFLNELNNEIQESK